LTTLSNAVAESFFATIKKELIHRRSWPTKADARTAIFDYIESFYNRVRLHSTLGQRAPEITRTELSSTTVRASPLRGSHTHPA
jgi:putative transposase